MSGKKGRGGEGRGAVIGQRERQGPGRKWSKDRDANRTL